MASHQSAPTDSQSGTDLGSHAAASSACASSASDAQHAGRRGVVRHEGEHAARLQPHQLRRGEAVVLTHESEHGLLDIRGHLGQVLAIVRLLCACAFARRKRTNQPTPSLRLPRATTISSGATLAQSRAFPGWKSSPTVMDKP